MRRSDFRIVEDGGYEHDFRFHKTGEDRGTTYPELGLCITFLDKGDGLDDIIATIEHEAIHACLSPIAVDPEIRLTEDHEEKVIRAKEHVEAGFIV